MSLHPDARANLSEADRNSLDLWERAAEAMPPEGPNVVTNLRNESHLVGDPPRTGSSALQAFLREIVTRLRTDEAKRAFENAAGAHLVEGRRLASTPVALHRFRPLDRFAESVAQENGETREANRDPDEYVTNLFRNWDTIGREKVSRAMLGVRLPVFVTFEKPDGTLVTDVFRFGPEIMKALGVRLQAEQDVIGLRYPPPADSPLKYPTTADGGWSRYFAASQPDDEHGWTRPVSNSETEGWPEAVHQNRTADLVTERPSRYPKTT